MDFKPPKQNESRGTARNSRKTRYTRPWTAMNHQRRSVITETIQATIGSSFNKKENFQPVCVTFRPFWMDSPSNTQSQTLYKRPLERILDMGRGTTETEERRMEHNCRRFSQCNNIRKTKTHTDYKEKAPGHLAISIRSSCLS